MAVKSAGIHSYVQYAGETDYGTAVTTNKLLGINTSFSPNLNNSVNQRYGFTTSATNGRTPISLVPGRANLKFNIDFDVVDFAWAEYVLGTATGAGTITYSFGIDTKSITVTDNIDDTTDRVDTYDGCVIQSATIKGAIDSPITASISCDCSDVTKGSTLVAKATLSDTQPYNFVGSTFEFPDSTAINNIVEGFDITVNNNYTLLFGSSRTSTAAVPGTADFNFKLTTKRVDDDLWDHVKGTATSISATTPETEATLYINLARGGDSVVLGLSGTVMPSEYMGIRKTGTPIGEDFTFLATNFTIVETLA